MTSSGHAGPLLALETSTRPATLALRRAGRVVSLALAEGRAHASDLIPALDEMLGAGPPAQRELSGVIVGLGPGSYTGLRVGIATALGLAADARAQLYGLPSTEVLAYGVLAPGEEGAVLLDAHGGRQYFAHYARIEEEIETRCPPRIARAEELEGLLPDACMILGDETVANAARLSPAIRERLVVERPHARHLLELGARRLERTGPMRADDLQPLYLRSFAARPRRR